MWTVTIDILHDQKLSKSLIGSMWPRCLLQLQLHYTVPCVISVMAMHPRQATLMDTWGVTPVQKQALNEDKHSVDSRTERESVIYLERFQDQVPVSHVPLLSYPAHHQSHMKKPPILQ